jgi:L-ribulokinase
MRGKTSRGLRVSKYALGLDFGTNSVRALIVDVANGAEVGVSVQPYANGENGILLSEDPNLARQHPADYLDGMTQAVRNSLKNAAEAEKRFKPSLVIGIGVDATGSTPLPVDAAGQPLALKTEFAKNLSAMAWLWKDHTSYGEAEEITALARKIRPQYLTKCGGTYSAEWFFSKILHCRRIAPKVFDAAYSWVELADWIPAVLTGKEHAHKIVRGVCAAGHKAMFHAKWGGLPDEAFLSRLDPHLGKLRSRLFAAVSAINELAGGLTDIWAKQFGLPAKLPVAVGAIDAHLGAIGSGIRPGTLVKILGTSGCDMMVAPQKQKLNDIPGLCGIVPNSILPGYYGLEAGQSAVGDIFNWFVNRLQPGGEKAGGHEALSRTAATLKAGESGLLALDWHNGNRCLLADQRLTGLLVGLTLHSTPAEIYRAWIESCAFGALKIINRFEEYDIPVKEIVNCGGIAEKSPLALQIYADVTGRPMKTARSSQTCALGAALCGAVAARVYPTVSAAQRNMTGTKSKVFKPNRKAHATYRKLFALYGKLHDGFGGASKTENFGMVMKELLAVRSAVRSK